MGVYVNFLIFNFFNSLIYGRDLFLTKFLTMILTAILTSRISTDIWVDRRVSKVLRQHLRRPYSKNIKAEHCPGYPDQNAMIFPLDICTDTALPDGFVPSPERALEASGLPAIIFD